ncbi:MAG: hypothetical protein WBV71_03530, partial [Roseobacter sp.]
FSYGQIIVSLLVKMMVFKYPMCTLRTFSALSQNIVQICRVFQAFYFISSGPFGVFGRRG